MSRKARANQAITLPCDCTRKAEFRDWSGRQICGFCKEIEDRIEHERSTTRNNRSATPDIAWIDEIKAIIMAGKILPEVERGIQMFWRKRHID